MCELLSLDPAQFGSAAVRMSAATCKLSADWLICHLSCLSRLISSRLVRQLAAVPIFSSHSSHLYHSLPLITLHHHHQLVIVLIVLAPFIDRLTHNCHLFWAARDGCFHLLTATIDLVHFAPSRHWPVSLSSTVFRDTAPILLLCSTLTPPHSPWVKGRAWKIVRPQSLQRTRCFM